MPFPRRTAAAAAAFVAVDGRLRRRRRLGGRRGCQPTGVKIHGHRHHDPEGGLRRGGCGSSTVKRTTKRRPRPPGPTTS